jgi:hypothetical protein
MPERLVSEQGTLYLYLHPWAVAAVTAVTAVSLKKKLL